MEKREMTIKRMFQVDKQLIILWSIQSPPIIFNIVLSFDEKKIFIYNLKSDQKNSKAALFANLNKIRALFFILLFVSPLNNEVAGEVN